MAWERECGVQVVVERVDEVCVDAEVCVDEEVCVDVEACYESQRSQKVPPAEVDHRGCHSLCHLGELPEGKET